MAWKSDSNLRNKEEIKKKERKKQRQKERNHHGK
jgi:hypothetical protein